MADLRKTRKRFKAVSIVFAVISALALLYLALPIGASNADLNSDLKQTNKDLEVKEQQVAPLRGLPEKLVKTNDDIINFYRTRLPDRQSDVSEELGKLASAENIALSEVKYENFDTDIPALRAVVVEAQLTGEYSHLAKFINAVERDKMFLIVDGLSLEDQKSEQKGGANTVRLTLRFGTCLRPADLAAVEPEKKPVSAASDKSTKRSESAAKPPLQKPQQQSVKKK